MLTYKQSECLKKHYNVFLKYLFALIIFAIGAFNIHKLNFINVLPDEYGYWSIGAFLSGYDWSEVTSHIPYYSYGYSIILSFLYKLSNDMTTIYRVALLLNVFMLVCSFFIASYCAQKILKSINVAYCDLIAFIITLYANNIIMVKIAWTETLLYMMYWLVTALLIKYFSNPSTITGMFLGASSVAMYIIHQRNIGVFISAIFSVLLFTLLTRSKKTMKSMFAFVVTIILLLIIHVKFKNYIVGNLWLENTVDNTLRNVNDFSGQLVKIKGIISSFAGFFKAVFGFMGKMFYLGAATMGIGLFGLFYAGKNSLVKSSENGEYNELNYIIINLFISLSSLLTLGISTIFFWEGTRQDTVVYGRYTDPLIGVLLLFGIIGLIYGKIKIKYKVMLCIVMSICTIISQYVIQLQIENNSYHSNYFNFYGSPSIAVFYQNEQFTVGLGVITIILMLFLVIISSFKTNNFVKLTIIGCICIFFWTYSSSYGVNAVITNPESASQKALIVRQLISDDDNAVIHYLTKGSELDSQKIEYLQFLLPKVKIHYATSFSIDNYLQNPQDWVLIWNNKSDVMRLLSEYSYIYEYEAISILVPKGSNQERRAIELGNTLKNIGNAIDYSTDFLSLTLDNDKIQEKTSNGEEGFFMYGPYISLEKGKYRIKLKLNIYEKKQNELGYIDIVSNQEEIIKVKLNDDRLMRNNGYVDGYIDFELDEDMNNIEYRVWLEEGVVAALDEFKIQIL